MYQILLLLAVLSVADVSQAIDIERILIPIAVSQSPGANGSRWTSDVQYRSDSEYRFVRPVTIADWSPPIHTTIQLPVFLLGPTDMPGMFLDIDKRASAETHISVRVYDVSRPASGVVLPGVREEEFSSTPLQFLNVPVPSPDAAVLLRVYDSSSQPGATVTIRVFRSGDNLRDEVLASETLPLFYQSSFAPGYVQYSLSSTPFRGPLRVEVTPDRADERLWAFITVTNPMTSEVTPIFDH